MIGPLLTIFFLFYFNKIIYNLYFAIPLQSTQRITLNDRTSFQKPRFKVYYLIK